MTSRLNTSNYAHCTQTVEPPYTERYVRWCERTVTQLMGDLLLDQRPFLFGKDIDGKGA